MNKIYISFVLIFVLLSCAKKDYEEIGFHIPGIETKISRVLINRNSFEGAVIKLLGQVKELGIGEDAKTNQSFTQFKIADVKGNYISVIGKGKIELQEDDVIILGGKYSSPTNTLYLSEYELIKPASK